MPRPMTPRTPELYQTTPDDGVITTPPAAVPADLVVGVFAAAVATYLALMLLTRQVLVAMPVGLVAVPVVLLRWLHAPAPAPWGQLAPALALRRPPARLVLAALVLGATFWLANLRLVGPLIDALGGRDAGSELVVLWSPRPWWLLAVEVVVVPALAEELVCRGLLAHGLVARLGRAGAVGVSALLFALLHLALARGLVTVGLGLVLGLMVVVGRSVWPAVLLHAVNNTVALAVGTGRWPALAGWIDAHPDLALAASLGGIALGGALLGSVSAPTTRPPRASSATVCR